MPQKQVHNSSGVIQADTISNCSIYQHIELVDKPKDIDQKIFSTRKTLSKLKVTRGLSDIRLPLSVLISVIIFESFMSWGPCSAPLIAVSLMLLYLGFKLSEHIDNLNAQIDAAKSLLTDLYKKKQAAA